MTMGSISARRDSSERCFQSGFEGGVGLGSLIGSLEGDSDFGGFRGDLGDG